MSFAFDMSHFETSPSNDVAPQNIADMYFARDTSHSEMLPSNDVAPRKIELISVMLETSHLSIDSCTLPEQSLARDNFRQVVTALLSSALDCGEKMDWPVEEFGDMETRKANQTACEMTTEI